MKHDYRNIMSAATPTGGQSSVNDNIVWLEHTVLIDLSVNRDIG